MGRITIIGAANALGVSYTTVKRLRLHHLSSIEEMRRKLATMRKPVPGRPLGGKSKRYDYYRRRYKMQMAGEWHGRPRIKQMRLKLSEDNQPIMPRKPPIGEMFRLLAIIDRTRGAA